MAKNSWCYLDENDQKISFRKNELENLIQFNQIKPQTLIWEPGASNWKSSSELYPELFLTDQKESTPHKKNNQTHSFLESISQNSSKTAPLFIMLGILLCFTVLGIPIGAVLLWCGFQLLQSNKNLNTSNNIKLEERLFQTQKTQNLFWKLLNLAILISVICVGIGIFVSLLFLFDIINLPQNWIEFFQKRAN